MTSTRAISETTGKFSVNFYVKYMTPSGGYETWFV
jgi:hypothetical protein